MGTFSRLTRRGLFAAVLLLASIGTRAVAADDPMPTISADDGIHAVSQYTLGGRPLKPGTASYSATQLIQGLAPGTGASSSATPPAPVVVPINSKTTFKISRGTFAAYLWQYTGEKKDVLQPCGALLPSGVAEITIAPGSFKCPLLTGAKGSAYLVELNAGGESSLYVHVTGRYSVFGDDSGIALTLVQPYHKRPDARSFTLNSGLSYYYSVSNLKVSWMRAILNVSLLDMDKTKDLEVGLGAGLLFRLAPLVRTTSSLGIAVGVGYNLMLDQEHQRPYYFVGLSLKLPTGNSNAAATDAH